MTTPLKPTGLALLREPFPDNQISKLPKPVSRDAPKGRCKECGGWHGLPAVHLDYVGHAALTFRLLDADQSWSWEPVAIDERGLPALDQNGGLWIRLTVCGVTRMGYGDAQGKTGPDAMKERIGDALRNAAMRFGAALDLWHKGDLRAHMLETGEDEPTQATDVPKISALSGARDAVSPEELASLQDLAMEAIAMVKDGQAESALAKIVAQQLTGEQHMALWTLLPSNVRSALKHAAAPKDVK